jgi:hypothetical protein
MQSWIDRMNRGISGTTEWRHSGLTEKETGLKGMKTLRNFYPIQFVKRTDGMGLPMNLTHKDLMISQYRRGMRPVTTFQCRFTGSWCWQPSISTSYLCNIRRLAQLAVSAFLIRDVAVFDSGSWYVHCNAIYWNDTNICLPKNND